jgi:hypothetical protein
LEKRPSGPEKFASGRSAPFPFGNSGDDCDGHDTPSMFPMIHVWFSLDLDEQVLVFISDSDVLYYCTPPRSGG